MPPDGRYIDGRYVGLIIIYKRDPLVGVVKLAGGDGLVWNFNPGWLLLGYFSRLRLEFNPRCD